MDNDSKLNLQNNKNEKLVSIIVPIYNVEQYIDRCISSLINQTLKDIEIILVDDGSPDNCPRICENYSERYENIKVIHKQNEGLGFARNSGIDIASGKYVIFVDSDDFVTNDMCEVLYNKAEKYNADIVYANHYKYKDNKICELVKEINNDIIFDTKESIREFMIDMIAMSPNKSNDTPIEVSVWGAIFKRNTLKENNIYFVSEREYISEDVVFNLELYPKTNKIVLCPEVVYYYCFNSSSLSKTYKKDRFLKDKILWKYIIDKFNSMNICAEDRLNRFLLARARCAMSSIVASESNHKNKKACKKLLLEVTDDIDVKTAVNHYPINKSSILKRIYFMALKARNIELLYWLCKLNNFRKRK